MVESDFANLSGTVRVLGVDDDKDIIEQYRCFFAPYAFYHFDGALKLDEAWSMAVHNEPYHVLLYDLTIQHHDKGDVTLIRHCARQTAGIILTGVEDSELSFRANNAGAVALLKKGLIDETTLLPVVNRWFMQALLGALPCHSVNPVIERIAEVLVPCRAATVTQLARLARIQRSRLKQVCSEYYHAQARIVLLAVRTLCAAFSRCGLCPADYPHPPVSRNDFSKLIAEYDANRAAIERFLHRAK